MGWMLEIPVVRGILAERMHRYLFALVEARFGPLPSDLTERLRALTEFEELDRLVVPLASCLNGAELANLLLNADEPLVVAAPCM
jgi:hypothetical protein